MATTDVICTLSKERPVAPPPEAVDLVRRYGILHESNLDCLTFMHGQFFVWQLTKDWITLDQMIEREDKHTHADLVRVYGLVDGYRLPFSGLVNTRVDRFMMLASFMRTMAGEESYEAMKSGKLPQDAWSIYGKVRQHMAMVQDAYWYITSPQLTELNHEWVKLERKLSGWKPDFAPTRKIKLKSISIEGGSDDTVGH